MREWTAARSSVLQRHSNSVKLLRIYAKFLEFVKIDPWNASKWSAEADRLHTVRVALTCYSCSSCLHPVLWLRADIFGGTGAWDVYAIAWGMFPVSYPGLQTCRAHIWTPMVAFHMLCIVCITD